MAKGLELDNEMDFDDDVQFVLTEWGILTEILSDYGIDVWHIPGRVGQHIVEDFMECMVNAGYIAKNEEEKV